MITSNAQEGAIQSYIIPAPCTNKSSLSRQGWPDYLAESPMTLTRRSFLAAAATPVMLSPGLSAKTQPEKPRMDLHVHLFGTGDSGSGCRLSKAITEGLQFRTLKVLLGIEKKGKTLDEGYVAVLAE